MRPTVRLLLLASLVLPHPSAVAGTTSFAYDALGRLSTVTYDNGVQLGYAFDAAGNLTRLVTGVPPSTPPTITSTTVGAGSVTFTFTPPSVYSGALITGYIASCTPGALSNTVSPTATSVTVTGLVKGTSYTCSLAPTSSDGTGTASNVAVVGGSQSIAFAPGQRAWIGINSTIGVSASSGLAVTLASTTPGICTVVSGRIVRGVAKGACTLTATQSGDANFLAAPSVNGTVPVDSIAAILNIILDSD